MDQPRSGHSRTINTPWIRQVLKKWILCNPRTSQRKVAKSLKINRESNYQFFYFILKNIKLLLLEILSNLLMK
jgi:hypothetical protein